MYVFPLLLQRWERSAPRDAERTFPVIFSCNAFGGMIQRQDRACLPATLETVAEGHSPTPSHAVPPACMSRVAFLRGNRSFRGELSLYRLCAGYTVFLLLLLSGRSYLSG